MLDLIRLYRDPEAEGGAATIEEPPVDSSLSEDAITQALKDEETTRAADKPVEKAAEKPSAKETPAADDPEFEIAFKDGKKKVKQSELLDAYEKSRDYTQKMQKIAETEQTHKNVFQFLNGIKANPKLTKLVLNVVQKSAVDFKDGKDVYDEVFIDKALGFFEGKNEQIEQKQEQVDVKIDELESKLKDLDQDSPLAQTIKSTINQLKGLYGKLEAQSKQIEKYGKDLASVQGSIKAQTEAQAREADTKAVGHASTILTEQLNAMTDSEKHKETAYAFDTDFEAKSFRREVLQVLKANPTEYKTPEEFANAIREAGKLVYKQVVEYRDALLAKHLKAPAKPITPTLKKEGEEAPKADESTLEGALETALNQTEGTSNKRKSKK